MRRYYTVRVSRICVVLEGKILLVQRSNYSLWEIPGGKVKSGESYLKAAHRELLEETGLYALSLKRIIADRRETPHGGVWVGTNYYRATAWETPHILAPTNPHEIRNVQWFTLKESLRLRLTAQTVEMFKNEGIKRLFGT